MKAALEAWLADKLGEPVEITQWRRHAEGFSWQTYTFWAGGEGFAVRREPEDGLLAPYDTEGQYRLHEALLRLGGVPVPELRWLELDRSVLGMPFYVMARVEGHVPVQWRGEDPIAFPNDAARRSVGEQFVDALAAIHALDWRETGLPGPRDEVAHWEWLLDEAVLVEVPLLREAVAWLQANRVGSGRVTLVHGDYRIGNFMLDSERRINAVFDWELAHAGDPVEDIAWASLKLFRGRSTLWSQLLSGEDFLARYEARTGLRVEPDVLRYFVVLCMLRTIVPYLRACRAFEEGRTRDLRLAAMGHQSIHLYRHLAAELTA